jgi:ribosome-associated protein
MTSQELAKRISALAQEKKGSQIVIINISKKSDFADFFVIISGSSNVQVKAICDHIEDELRNEAVRPYHKEGYEYNNWVLLDYVDVIVHVFKNETREFYGIERLWADAEMEFIKEETA